jgi:hypothetical protein
MGYNYGGIVEVTTVRLLVHLRRKYREGNSGAIIKVAT